jgi:glycosyltransferase involved in cell wall biosynthesis
MTDRAKQENNPEISIIIPSYNSENHILNCLNSIYTQKTDLKYEVIIIDSSDNDLSPLIKKQFPSVRFYHIEGRVYPGSARNIGVSYSCGKIIAFTDSDCVVSENWLENIYQSLTKKRKNIVGGSISNGYSSNLIATGEYLMEFGEFLPEKAKGVVAMIPSCNFGIKKELFEKAKGFPDFITAEDVMFSNKLNELDEKIYFDSSVNITHFNRRNFFVFLLKQKELGIGSCVLRRTIKIKGHLLTKYRILSLFIPIIRIYTVWRKVLINDFRYLLQLIITFPFVFVGLLAYGYGFWSGFSVQLKSN